MILFSRLILRYSVRKYGCSLMFSMARCSNFAIVRNQADDLKIQLTFVYGNALFQERTFNFNRSKEEEIGVLFNRIRSNIETVSNKKTKRKKKGEEGTGPTQVEPLIEQLVVTLEDELNRSVSAKALNVDAWKSGYVLTVGETKYNVKVNAPTVRSLTLPKSIMAGFPVYPKIDLEFCSRDQSHFEWFRAMKREELEGNACLMSTHWQKAGTGLFYTTENSDVGRPLKVVCMPSNGSECGLEVEAVSQNSVSAGPGQCPFEERHLFTLESTPKNSFRVVTYNILANLYADSEHTRTVLYPYCPPYALEADYRKQLLMKEILGYNGDLICLQEVDSKLFYHDLQPILSSVEMDGKFMEKGGQVVEGLACFANRNKFSIRESEGIILADELPNNPIFGDIYQKICENEKLKERILARTTALQVLVMESVERPGCIILVGNTHLYFHPDSDHIRLLQAAICIRFLEKRLEKLKLERPEKTVCVLLCGDFNSCPEFGVYQLMTTGSVPETSADWQSAPEESISGLSVSQALDFQSACGTPEYTNYTVGFFGCLDYIFYQPSILSLDSTVPLSTHEQVVQHTALPSVVFPSDHISLIANLSWKS